MGLIADNRVPYLGTYKHEHVSDGGGKGDSWRPFFDQIPTND